MADIQPIPLYIAGKSTTIRVPVPLWEKMQVHAIDNGESMSSLMLRLLIEHFGIDDQEELWRQVRLARVHSKKSANSLVNELLAQFFNGQ